ncbi:septum formation inhibitor Maf [Arsenicitalea aurantiaca]|uniref:Nucleoside triphosphate pyrophosphatase n=1 Tax=Arsenicitalea aurantiaca TaxID=1783274 RepID=A0A433X7W3_9HYPH|nr:Maf family protein [Arsenicitalea aurantiaca]RUT30149.1 septum formation inhibitor Maf [Arsenicitalea aurantiaca]
MLILASQSRTRHTLLEQAGLVFLARPARIDERAVEKNALAAVPDARDVALNLAVAKAADISATEPGAVVIGADQTLALGTELLHKPASRDDAAEQLMRLSGKTHRLHAGVALLRDGEVLWADVHSAELTMRAFSKAECEAILALEGDRILASVGGYRLEGPSIRLFEAVSGDYFTILGLPLLPLLGALRHHAPELLDHPQ